MEYFINPGIARITVIEVPIIEDLLYKLFLTLEQGVQRYVADFSKITRNVDYKKIGALLLDDAA